MKLGEVMWNYDKFGDILVYDVISKLNGTHDDFQRFQSPDKPSRNIILGTLSDRTRLDFSEDSGDVIEEKRSISSVKNNSLSVKFLVKDNSAFFNIKTSFSVFYRAIPTFEEQLDYTNNKYKKIPNKVELAPIWERKDLEFPEISIGIEQPYDEEYLDFDEHIQSLQNDLGTLGRLRTISSDMVVDESKYNNEIRSNGNVGIPNFNWQCKVFVTVEDFVQSDVKLKLVEIGIVNLTDNVSKTESNYETFLFNSKLEINLGDIKIVPFDYKYQFEDFPRNYDSPFRCLNCHATLSENKIVTAHFAKYKQKKVTPRISIDGISLSFDELSSDDGINKLDELSRKMDEYYDIYQKSPKIKDSLYSESLKNFGVVKERFNNGLTTLKNNEKAFLAFKLMNNTFLHNAKKYTSWRLFQIVFIVSIINDIVDESSGRDICEVLHVMTGGGKSEAYFGLVIFSAFWDRLSGKKFGVTAITKFPLRMLSIQQLQRISNLFIWAEKIRSEEDIGGEPFSVSYFVGNSDDFPSDPCEISKKIRNASSKGVDVAGKIIDVCPLCNDEVIMEIEEDQEFIIHKCKGCNETFRLFFTDQETYRFLPTFIVATDDKFAGIGLNRRFKNLFGGKLDRCSYHGFIPRNDRCDVNLDDKCRKHTKFKCNAETNPVKIDFKTGPTLIIQDEMHLIKEGFGTIDSHFESLIETLQEEFCGYKFKNIAMTATVTGAKNQIDHLYHKKSRIFPGNLSDDYENDFFFTYEYDDDKNPISQRQLVGLKPNLRDNHFASLLTLKHLSEFIEAVENDIDTFSQTNGFKNDELIEIINNYKSILTYHNRKNDAKAMRMFLDTVVNSKLDNYLITPKVLTGDNSLDEIKELINLVNTYYEDPNSDKKTLLSVFATSIVSHGVDIDNWNIMVIQGMPRNTAEYIQALSRVGRKYHGIVFLWFYPNRSRDLSFYQNFNGYHQILHHKVESVPLSRWAKLGFKQTITSMFNAGILNYISDIIGSPIYKVADVNDVFASIERRNELIQFIRKAYVLDSSMIGVEYFDKQISSEVESRLNYLATYTGRQIYFFPNALKDYWDKYYNTPTGMRGIQDQVTLIPHENEYGFYQKI